MFKEVVKELNWGGHTLTLKTGKVARQSDGAVVASMGDTVVLCTAVSAPQAKEDASFFPLTVHYREMAFAAGKFPGGYKKREGQASEREVLVSRLIDRPLRPLFDPGFLNETQVICTVLSYDPMFCSDVVALIGASAALSLSGAPLLHVVGAAKVGLIDEKYILNPSISDLEKSKLDLVVAGTDSSVMMVESEAHELNEDEMLKAIEFGHNQMQPVIQMIEELKKEAGKATRIVQSLETEDLTKAIIKDFGDQIESSYKIKEKHLRYNALSKIDLDIKNKFQEEYAAVKIGLALAEAKSQIVRSFMLSTKTRIDGRKPEEIRPITSEITFLPRAHGSSLFTRGETQALVATTLGSTQDEQMVESLEGDNRDRFLLHYIFPAYSVGETFPFRAPGRREVGHGKLAWRAINPVLPTKENFPYSIRVVSEITESNGSSSMATVCGASMALMDAGVPIKSPVAGIAMGLVKESEKYIILSDIMGDEDYIGDMDFKVAGTSKGITALQMDIKITGINLAIMKEALAQAHEGRNHIILKMEEAITEHKDLSEYAPQITTINVPKDKIREIIGSGGRVIKDLCEVSGAKIDIDDDGLVKIAAVGKDKIQIALDKIKAIIYEPQIGDVLEGVVVKILDSGAFISIPGGKDGYLHISEISQDRVKSVDDVLSQDMKVKVKIIDFDRGKVKVSIKALTQNGDYAPRNQSNEGGFPKRRSSDRDASSPRRDSRDSGDSRGFKSDNSGDKEYNTSKPRPRFGSKPNDRGGTRKPKSRNTSEVRERKFFN